MCFNSHLFTRINLIYFIVAKYYLKILCICVHALDFFEGILPEEFHIYKQMLDMMQQILSLRLAVLL